MKTAEDLALDALENEKQRRLKENKLAYYHPYPKQHEFTRRGRNTARDCCSPPIRS